LDLAGDSKGSNKKSLDAHTIHVSRLTKERRRESKDSSRTASSLQLNIGDPSSVDLASFPALHDADSASTPPPARRCVSASAAPSAFSSSLQLDISNPSNVNTCSFPPADAADVGGSIEPASSSIAKGTTSADANAVVNAAARQPTKDSVPGLFFKVQSHILRHPIFTSQT
jgi:hypothetical protein